MLFGKMATFINFLKFSKYYVNLIGYAYFIAIVLTVLCIYVKLIWTGSDFCDLYVVLLINRIRRLDRNVLKNIWWLSIHENKPQKRYNKTFLKVLIRPSAYALTLTSKNLRVSRKQITYQTFKKQLSLL